MRRLVALLLLPCAACAATVPLTDHRDQLEAQQSEYEVRLKRAEETRRALEEDCTRGREDAIAQERDLRTRIQRLEIALADKERLLAADGSERREPRGAALERIRSALAGAAADLPDDEKTLEKQGGGQRLILSLDLFFSPGSVRLTPDGERRARKLGEALAALGRVQTRIAVHADAVPIAEDGPVADTWELTQKQGWAVLQGVLAAGVDPSRLTLIARGHHAPRAPSDGAGGRADNRRVEITVVPLVRTKGP